MNLNKSVSWKITIPLAVVFYVFFGDFGKFLALILGALGIIDLCRQFFKKK